MNMERRNDERGRDWSRMILEEVEEIRLNDP